MAGGWAPGPVAPDHRAMHPPVVGGRRRLRRPDPVRRPGCRPGRVMVGTRFLMAQETDIGPRLRQTVIDARETDTVLTQTSIRNAPALPETQGALDIIAFEQHHPTFDELYPLIRGTVTKAAYEQDEPQAAQIAIGQVLGRIHDVKPAAPDHPGDGGGTL